MCPDRSGDRGHAKDSIHNRHVMNTTLLILIVAVAAVGAMVLGLSITLIRKGRNIQSDVGGNDEMKKRGLICASEQFRREEALLRGEDPNDALPCDGHCGSCSLPEEKKCK